MNQRALWADPNVRRERQARAEAFMCRPMEFDEECAEMKSSKDIPPRVGMQVRADYPFLSSDRRNVTSLVGWHIGMNGSNLKSDRCLWNSGAYEIEWQPPTDDERRLFMEAARHCANVWKTGSFRLEDCSGMCAWGSGFYSCEQAAIAESLALDGADYGNMPDFEELER